MALPHNYSHVKQLNVITHPYLNIGSGLVKKNGWVIIHHRKNIISPGH